MGRNKKVTAQEILETIQDNGTLTKRELSEIFEVCIGTVSKRLRELRDDGEGILNNENGLFVLEEIRNEEDRIAFQKYFKWWKTTIIGLAKCGKVTKPLLLESKKYIKTLSSKERKLLINMTSQINRIVSNIELEDEMEDEFY